MNFMRTFGVIALVGIIVSGVGSAFAQGPPKSPQL